MVATPTSFSPMWQLSYYQDCIGIIKSHQIVCEIREFISLESSAQVLIASPVFLLIKNEDLSIIVCPCQSTVKLEADRKWKEVGNGRTSLFLTLKICETPKVMPMVRLELATPGLQTQCSSH